MIVAPCDFQAHSIQFPLLTDKNTAGTQAALQVPDTQEVNKNCELNARWVGGWMMQDSYFIAPDKVHLYMQHSMGV